MEEITIDRIYKHIKSGNHYKVISLGRVKNFETEYDSQWHPSVNYVNEAGNVFTRIKNDFEEKFELVPGHIDIQGNIKPGFYRMEIKEMKQIVYEVITDNMRIAIIYNDEAKAQWLISDKNVPVSSPPTNEAFREPLDPQTFASIYEKYISDMEFNLNKAVDGVRYNTGKQN